MDSAWISFVIVISVQALIMYGFAWYYQALPALKKKLLPALLLSLPFGVTFDLIFGHALGIYGYELGFEYVFLALNGFFFFGFMMATLLAFSEVSFFRFYAMTALIALLYEPINYLFPVWHWTFADSMWVEFLVLALAAYCGLALMMAACLQALRISSFAFLSRQ